MFKVRVFLSNGISLQEKTKKNNEDWQFCFFCMVTRFFVFTMNKNCNEDDNIHSSFLSCEIRLIEFLICDPMSCCNGTLSHSNKSKVNIFLLYSACSVFLSICNLYCSCFTYISRNFKFRNLQTLNTYSRLSNMFCTERPWTRMSSMKQSIFFR